MNPPAAPATPTNQAVPVPFDELIDMKLLQRMHASQQNALRRPDIHSTKHSTARARREAVRHKGSGGWATKRTSSSVGQSALARSKVRCDRPVRYLVRLLCVCCRSRAGASSKQPLEPCLQRDAVVMKGDYHRACYIRP